MRVFLGIPNVQSTHLPFYSENARSIAVSTHRIGQEGSATRIPGEDDEEDVDEKKMLSFLPTHSMLLLATQNYRR